MSSLSDWKSVKFGAIAEQIIDRVDNPTDSELADYIGLEHIESNNLKISNYGKSNGVVSSKFVCRKGDIIFGRRRAYLRKLAISERCALVSTDAMVIRPKDNVSKEFLILTMQTDRFWDDVISRSAGSLSPRIKWRDLSIIDVLLPPPKVQKEISKLIFSVQDNLEKTENFIQVAEKLKKGLLEELLTKGIGHTEFKKTEFGEIPEEWDLVELGCVLKPNFGLRITQKNDTGVKYPVYGGGGISFHTDNFNREDEFVISRFAMSEECVRFVNDKFYMLDSGFTIDAIDEIPKEYLGIFLTIKQDLIYSCGRGPAQKNLDIKQFLKIPFPKPTKNEAEKVIQIYNNFIKVDNELNMNKKNLHLLKKKLTNSLLSGELTVFNGA
jgi:type I restriction enzyme S subunit